MEPWGGHSMHILASTSNEKIFFDMLRNNDKITIYFILNYRHHLHKLFWKKTPIS